MAKLIYSTIGSLDGYVVDERGNFDWAAPDEEVHALVNELTRPVGTFLFGRRMYETLAAWDTMDEQPNSRPSSTSSPRSGRRRARSCSRGRSRPCRPRGPGSSASSTRSSSGG